MPRAPGSISSSSGGSDCTSATIPPRDARGQRARAGHWPPAPVGRRADAYIFASSPTGSVDMRRDGGPGVTTTSRQPHATSEDEGSSEETREPEGSPHNAGWQEFYASARALDNRQQAQQARPHYVGRHHSIVAHGVDRTVDRTVAMVDKDTDDLNSMLERLATPQVSGAPSLGSPDKKAVTTTDKEVDRIVRAVRRQYTILNRSVEVANMTADMYLCGLRNYQSEHWGGGVHNRTRPFVGEPLVAREMARTVIASPMNSPTAEADPETQQCITHRSSPEGADDHGTPGPFTSTITRHQPSAQDIAEAKREDAVERRYVKEVNATVRAEETANRKADASAQWSDRGYSPRATPVMTRSTGDPPSVRIGMLRTVESVQKSGWRIERAALNREARARGATTAGHGQTANPTAPHPPLVSSQYPANDTDHRCPNCYGYHPDPGKGHKTVWYSCQDPWDETCWEKHNKREARLSRAGRTPEHKDHGTRPDITVLMTVLDLLPSDITENIMAAQEMISNRATDEGTSDPPLEELDAWKRLSSG